MLAISPFRGRGSTQVIQRIGIEGNHVSPELKVVMRVMSEQTQERSVQILADIERFHKESHLLIEKLDNLLNQVSMECSQGQLSSERTSLIKKILETTRISIQFTADSSKQCLALQRRGREIFSEQAYQVVCIVMESRRAEIDLVQKELFQCYEQEKHEIINILQNRAIELKVETQLYNQVFQIDKKTPFAIEQDYSQKRVQIAQLMLDPRSYEPCS